MSQLRPQIKDSLRLSASLKSARRQQRTTSLGNRFNLVLLAGLMVLSSVITVYTPVFAATNITGTVYNDYNGNGVQDNANGATSGLAIDAGVSGVTVKAFDTDGANCATTTTGGNGSYTLNMGPCNGTTFRVEFSTLPAGYQPTQVGGANATTTQFVTQGGVANLGVHQPGNFCQNNPTVVTNCYRAGDRVATSTANSQMLTGSQYSASEWDAQTLNLGTQTQIGSTFGLAFRKNDRSMFTSTLYKRHADIGPGGMGAIYKSGPIAANSTGTVAPTVFATIPNAGSDRHPVSDVNCNGRDGSVNSGTPANNFSCWRWDTFSFGVVGKTSLGDMDIYEDPTNAANDALFVVNLNDRNLYKVTNLSGTPTVSSPIAMPLALPGASQGCALSDVRPFALSIYNGVGYAGFTCSAESTQNTANLRSYVYTFDPTSNTFSSAPILEVPLNFERTCYINCNSDNITNWRPWVTNSSQVSPGLTPVGLDFELKYATPLLTDISLGATPSEMTLGFRDRTGDQWAEGLSAPDDLTNDVRYYTIPFGDIMRACLSGSTWSLENGGTCGSVGPGANPETNFVGRGQGPGSYEFYNHDYLRVSNTDNPRDDGEEISTGGLAAIPGTQEVMQTGWGILDNVPADNGIHTYNANTGTLVNSHGIYDGSTAGGFGKVNGLGDIEVLCDSAPVEVGNRIWRDTNDNGVQDAGEPPIAGVTVNLYDGSNNLIGSVVTDSQGGYYFSNRSTNENGGPLTDSTGKDYGITALTTNTTGYQIRLDNPADYSDPTKLQGLFLTIADSTQDSGNNQNDSDANLVTPGTPSGSNAPFVTFNTGPAGANNHTYDFGFTLTASVIPPPTTGGGNNGDGTTAPSSGLASTGQNLLWLITICAVLIVGGGSSYYYLRRRHAHLGSR